PEQVALDGGKRRSGQPDRVGGDGQVTAYEGEVAGLDRGVRTGTHGDAEIGGGECGRVVDAVSDHRDDSAAFLQPSHDADLVRGQHLGDDVVDADLSGDRLGDSPVVAGQQHRSQPQ